MSVAFRSTSWMEDRSAVRASAHAASSDVASNSRCGVLVMVLVLMSGAVGSFVSFKTGNYSDRGAVSAIRRRSGRTDETDCVDPVGA